MSVQDEIPRIDDELEEARRALQNTVSQVSQKFKSVEDRLNPERMLERYAWPASCVAAVVGFIMGSNGMRSTAEAVIAGSLLVGVMGRAFDATQEP
ncbi:MAG TPA: hypothetical protein VJN94_06680 [Candidatus Binataceae bacterium]|nr:hypothetical protein [Candidatus Binataceae bacterium]